MDNTKKFEDFLGRIQGLLDNAKKQGHIIVRVEDIEKTFPELIENEDKDENIRKSLISKIKDMADYNGNFIAGNYDEEQIIAWLEKQGEQKPIDKVGTTPIFSIGDTLKRKGKDYTFIVDRIQGGYYHCDHSNGAFFPI